MQQVASTNYYVGSLIGAVAGIVLFVFFHFVGWYERIPFGIQPIQRWYYIGILSPYFPMYIAFVGALGYAGYVSYLGLRGGQVPSSSLTWAYRSALFVFVGSLAAAVIFIISVVATDTEDWWLDTGFFGAALGSGLAAVFLHLAVKQRTASETGRG